LPSLLSLVLLSALASSRLLLRDSRSAFALRPLLVSLNGRGARAGSLPPAPPRSAADVVRVARSTAVAIALNLSTHYSSRHTNVREHDGAFNLAANSNDDHSVPDFFS
jgi:hypothetical protein